MLQSNNEFPRRALTYDDICGYLRRFTYKPNFDLRCIPGDQQIGPALIQLTMYVPDSTKPNHPGIHLHDYANVTERLIKRYYKHDIDLIPVQGNIAVPWNLPKDERLFFDWLRRQITDLEMHELDEWFKVDGQLIHDPHADNQIA